MTRTGKNLLAAISQALREQSSQKILFTQTAQLCAKKLGHCLPHFKLEMKVQFAPLNQGPFPLLKNAIYTVTKRNPSLEADSAK